MCRYHIHSCLIISSIIPNNGSINVTWLHDFLPFYSTTYILELVHRCICRLYTLRHIQRGDKFYDLCFGILALLVYTMGVQRPQRPLFLVGIYYNQQFQGVYYFNSLFDLTGFFDMSIYIGFCPHPVTIVVKDLPFGSKKGLPTTPLLGLLQLGGSSQCIYGCFRK